MADSSTEGGGIYLAQSVVRGRTNRTQRAMQTGRRAFVQKFAGGTVLVRRARPARLTEAVLRANLAEFQKAVEQHLIVVTTLSGAPVNLWTFAIDLSAAASSPRPNPPLDSAKNDKNENVGYDVPPIPMGTTDKAPVPELVRRAAQSVEEEVEEEAAAPEASPPPPPPPQQHYQQHGGKHGKKKR